MNPIIKTPGSAATVKSPRFSRLALLDLARALVIAATLVAAASAQVRSSTDDTTQTLTSNNKEEEPQSPLALQTRIWEEGFAAGEQFVQSGDELLDVEAIDQKASAKYPTDLTADILWSTGFECGQLNAASTD